MKFNKKYTTIAIYACLVIIFAVVCVYMLLSLDKGRFTAFAATLRGVISKIFIGAIIAYILNPVVKFFENFVFVKHSSRKKIWELRKQAKAADCPLTISDVIDELGIDAAASRKASYDKKLEEFKKNPTKKLGKRTVKRKEPKYKPHPYRGLSILCTFMIFFLAIYIVGSVVIPQLGHSIADLTVRVQSLKLDKILADIQNNSTLNQIYTTMVDNGFNLADALKGLQDVLLSFLARIPNYLFSTIKVVYQTVYDWIIGIIFAVYFLISKDLLSKQFRYVGRSFFPDKVCYWVKFLIRDIDSKFGKFIEGKIVDSLIVGLLSFIVFSIFGIPYAAMIAMIIGITNIIPFFGPFIGAIPSAFLILIAQPSKVIVFIILILVIQQIDGNLIGPYILGDSLELPPVWIMIAIITMGGLFGFFGMFFGVPIFAVIFTLIKELAVISREKKEKKMLSSSQDNAEDE